MYLIWLVACEQSFRSGPVEDVGIRRETVAFGADFGDAGVQFFRGDEIGPTLSFRAWGQNGESRDLPMPVVEAGELIRYSFEGVSEEWTTEAGGLRQSWEVRDGESGTLTFEIAVDGADVSVSDDGRRAILTTGDGPDWQYSEPKAWDANQRELSAWLEESDSGVRVVVEAEGAEFPVRVDPLMTTAAWSVNWPTMYEYFGQSLAGAGDVDADGYDDVIIATGSGTSSQLYTGSATGLSPTAAWSTPFGRLAAGAGDVNGDGYDDVLLADNYSKTAKLYLGSISGLNSAAAWSVTSGFRNFGAAIAGAGDVNNDGYDDILIGAPEAEQGQTYEGLAFLFLGSAAGPSATPDWTGEENKQDAQLGYSVASAGDVNGDGYGDVVIGAPFYNHSGGYSAGRAYVYLGSASGLAVVAAWSADGVGANADFGLRVAGAGDTDGDSFDDVIVGAPLYSNGEIYEGGAFVFRGSASGISSSPFWSGESDEAYSEFGQAVAGAGDVNGDGFADIAIGVPYASRSGAYEAGAAYLFEGTSAGPGTVAQWSAEGASERLTFGWAVAAAGDVNGDHYADLVVGAPEWQTSAHRGSAYLYAGYPELCYQDLDGDGFGTTTEISTADLDCSDAGESSFSTDCDDADSGINPDESEILANGVDEDCDGGDACYLDADGDSHGTVTTVSSTDLDCSDTGESPVSDDCDDSASTTFLGAAEVIADGIDQNCDGYDNCYADADGDKYGSALLVITTNLSCSDAGEAPDNGDCDDADSAIKPGATEGVADGVDQNCDTLESCYADTDGDGFGNSSTISSVNLTCGDAGESSVSTDCDAGEASVYPGAPEIIADGTDQDCDSRELCYFDEDRDGYGKDWSLESLDLDCVDSFESILSSDCDDTSSGIHPFAAESAADGVDQDCDGGDTCFSDTDGDGFGSTSLVAGTDLTCANAGESALATDCNDAQSDVSPAVLEIPQNGTDDNCDGAEACYQDTDGDGFGTGITVSGDLGCNLPSSDCDDTNASIYPAAPETPADATDQDCDGGDTCYADRDSDTYGSTFQVPSPDLSCADVGESTVATDCDDRVSGVYPGAPENPQNGTDEDCDGLESCYQDTDGDGFASLETAPGELTCNLPNSDCDDSDGSIFPGAAETPADGTDQDCDGTEICFTDADADGYGSNDVYSGEIGCLEPSSDCDDANADVNPGSLEIVADGVDQDCDGSDNCYSDADRDGYGTEALVVTIDLDCVDPGESSNTSDCDDQAVRVRPGADEIPANGVDENCDGEELCYIDADNDGAASLATENGTLTCSATPNDCDDSNATIRPAADETCNGQDDDCDGGVDEKLNCAVDVPLLGCGAAGGALPGVIPVISALLLMRRRSGRR